MSFTETGLASHGRKRHSLTYTAQGLFSLQRHVLIPQGLPHIKDLYLLYLQLLHFPLDLQTYLSLPDLKKRKKNVQGSAIFPFQLSLFMDLPALSPVSPISILGSYQHVKNWP